MPPHIELDIRESGNEIVRRRLGSTEHKTNESSFPAYLAAHILHDSCFEGLHPEEVADEFGPVCSSGHHQKVLEEQSLEVTFTSR
ncbi:MAG: hypothetical protein M1575_01860 [Patescibacteria group bacterium]|nr:hypothetical protein [Patescibacteria group bacterium]MCL5095448.1 hypothetical protein [Patescibacteria group bacterium]